MKGYWFILSNIVYVSYGDKGMLLYHTATGNLLETNDADCMGIIKEAQSRVNLGVCILTTEQLKDKNISCFLNQLIAQEMGQLKEIIDINNKPISLLPVLNLQSDIKRRNNTDKRMIGENIMIYLATINVYVNSTCNNNCTHCSSFHRQVMCCTRREDNKELPIDKLECILEQVAFSSLGKINILGGNILKYSALTSLLRLISKLDIKVYYWLHYLHLKAVDDRSVMHLLTNKCIVVNFPLEKIAFSNITNYLDEKMTFYFLVESDEQIAQAKEIIVEYALTDYRLLPVYNKRNLDFFEKNVFFEKDDLFSDPISFRKIFCNRTLNSNFFGTAYILPDGEIKSNLLHDALGNIDKMDIMDALSKEMNIGGAWLKVRNEQPCMDCLYRELCPPISNYEQVLCKNNLCLIR